MSKYIIFQNKKGESLVYYPCAKNANSSAKLFFIKQLKKENEIFFIEDEIPRYKKDDYKKIFVPNSSLADILIDGLCMAGWEPED